MRRLAAFALLISAAHTVNAQQAPNDTNWQIAIQVDPITDLQQGSARIVPVAGAGKLIIACNGLLERTLSVQYSADKYLGSDTGIVIVRINKAKLMPATLWEVKDRTVFTTDDKWIAQFGQELGEGETEIVVRALDFQDQPHDRIFRSKNGASAFRAMAEICSAKPKK